MIIPNKFIRLDESVLGHLGRLLDLLNEEQYVEVLYSRVSHDFENIDQFIYALDVLFVLDFIYFDNESRKLIYVKRNKLRIF